MEISPTTQQLLPFMTEVRRALHSQPELSSCEFLTSKYIKSQLNAMGVPFTAAHTGLIADIKGRSGKTVAFRADFDGLPIAEKTGLPFASTNGNMHACGHDGHTAMLLGATKYLVQNPPHNNVRLIFQFGEEGDGGALTMIEHGALDGVDKIFAFHLCPELEKGRLGANRSALFAGVAEFNVHFVGKSSHCASRGEGADALAAAAEFAVRSRSCERPCGTLVHIGKITAGSARNVVAGEATLECSFRFFDKADRDPVLADLSALADAQAKVHGCTAELTVKAIYPPLINDPSSVDTLARVAELTDMDGRFTAEDFAFYLEKTSGCMAWLGIRDEKHNSPLHSDTFDFDESVLCVGAEAFIKLAQLQEL